MTSTQGTTKTVTITNSLAAGIAGGLAGGVVFGVVMQARDLMPMVAQLINSDSVAVGWLVHLFNSALFGVIFALLFGRWLAKLVPAIGAGLAYGLLWWLLGALMIMPAWLGMADMVFEVGENQWWSLAGHLIYGVILGLVTALFVRRQVTRD